MQYGKGLAAGDSLGKNGWGWANLENTQSWRVVLDSVASMGDLEISTFAFWQKDKNYRWWTEDDNGWGLSLIHISAGHRAQEYSPAADYAPTPRR